MQSTNYESHQNLSRDRLFSSYTTKTVIVPFFILLLPIIKFAGPYEGSQIDKIHVKSDWWGALTPLVPEILNLGSSRLAWVAFYAVIILLLLFIQSKVLSSFASERRKFSILVLITFQYLSTLYVLTNGRDGLAYFLISISVSLSNLARQVSNRLARMVAISLASFCIVSASQFKITTLPIAVLIFMLLRIVNNLRSIKNIVVTFLLGFMLALGGVLADSQLVATKVFTKSFPAQQVMLYDIANVYCWSQDEESRNFAAKILDSYRTGNAEGRTLCASAAPYGWDLLRLPWIEWSADTPLKQVSVEDENSYNNLTSDWLELIRIFPEEWLETKVNHIGQVLFMSNVFFAPVDIVDPNLGVLDVLVWTALLPANILDSLLLTSLGFSFLISILILSRRPILGFITLLVQLTGLVVNSLTFIANNGRYTFFTVLLSILIALHLSFEVNEKHSDKLM